MAKVPIYRSYRFMNKDHIIDRMKTLIADEGLKSYDAALIADMSPATLKNWFEGDTRRPQFSSIAALTTSLGYEMDFKKSKNKVIDADEEKRKTKEWREEQAKLRKPPQRIQNEFRW